MLVLRPDLTDEDRYADESIPIIGFDSAANVLAANQCERFLYHCRDFVQGCRACEV
jgi:hypothetical protein